MCVFRVCLLQFQTNQIFWLMFFDFDQNPLIIHLRNCVVCLFPFNLNTKLGKFNFYNVFSSFSFVSSRLFFLFFMSIIRDVIVPIEKCHKSFKSSWSETGPKVWQADCKNSSSVSFAFRTFANIDRLATQFGVRV